MGWKAAFHALLSRPLPLQPVSASYCTGNTESLFFPCSGMCFSPDPSSLFSKLQTPQIFALLLLSDIDKGSFHCLKSNWFVFSFLGLSEENLFDLQNVNVSGTGKKNSLVCNFRTIHLQTAIMQWKCHA